MLSRLSEENPLQLCTVFYDYSAENNTTIDFHIHNRLTAMICVLHKSSFFLLFCVNTSRNVSLSRILRPHSIAP